MTQPLVTAVIPTYNRAHLIGDALDSIAGQSYGPIEIVVIDDGSSDGTETVVQDWARAHPDLSVRFVTQSHMGGNAARNRGIAEARGEYVAFLDSDDRWVAEKIALQLALMGARPEVGAVYCGVFVSVLETGETMAMEPRRWPEGDILKELLVRDGTAPTSAWLVRREVFDLAGVFDVTLSARQDWDMWIRVAQQTQIGAVTQGLVEMRSHAGPRTISDPNRELLAHRAILRKYSALRRRAGLPSQLAALAAFHRRAGRVAVRYRNRPLAALGHYLAAILVWPLAADSYAALLGLVLPAALRRPLRRAWNAVLGRTALAIRSH